MKFSTFRSSILAAALIASFSVASANNNNANPCGNNGNNCSMSGGAGG